MTNPCTAAQKKTYQACARFMGEATNLQEEADCWALELALNPGDAMLRRELALWCQQSDQHQHAWEKACLQWQSSQQDMQNLFKQSQPKRLPSTQRRWFLGAGLSAACGIAVWGLSPLGLNVVQSWEQWKADYATLTGERKVLQLAQHLTVQLNTRSALSVEQSAGRISLILHSGELAVQTHNQWCDLHTGTSQIQLFNSDLEVRQFHKQHLLVQCRQGWAQVQWEGRAYALQAGQAAHFRSGQAVQINSEQSVGSSWREGMLVFHEQPLQSVIDEVNRYRPGRVVLLNQDYAQRRFSANLHIENVDVFIEQLKAQPGWQVRQVGEYVLLS